MARTWPPLPPALLEAAALALTAVGIAVLWATKAQPSPRVPVRIGLLLGVAILVAVGRHARWLPGLGVLTAAWAGLGFVTSDGPRELVGEEGFGVAVGRGLQAVGVTVAAWAGVRAWRSPAALPAVPGAAVRPGAPPAAVAAAPDLAARGQAVALLLLAPICAEYLGAYDDSTGNPLKLLAGLLIFVPLYGCPALLIREVARRARLGWIGILWLATAGGILQAGIVDQSLFSTGYRELGSWASERAATLIAPLGISAHMTLGFVGGHVMASFAAPIALIEGLRRSRRLDPWIGRPGLVLVTLATRQRRGSSTPIIRPRSPRTRQAP